VLDRRTDDDAAPSAEGTRRPRATRRRPYAAIALIVVASLVLLSFARASLGVWRLAGPGSGLVTDDGRIKARYDCVTRELRDRIPPGAVVHVRADQPINPMLWRERLVEMSYPYATIVDDPDQADYEVGIVGADPGTGCAGVEVTIEASR
jgi:hypothetical protein